MRIRIESPFPIGAGLFKPVKQRRVAALGHTVHWYEINHRDLDVFLRSLHHHYDYNHVQQLQNRDEYRWYASLTLYYRGSTIALNLSLSRLYHNPQYRLQYRRELSGEFGFYPAAIEFWECDTESDIYMYQDIRTFLNAIVRGGTQ